MDINNKLIIQYGNITAIPVCPNVSPGANNQKVKTLPIAFTLYYSVNFTPAISAYNLPTVTIYDRTVSTMSITQSSVNNSRGALSAYFIAIGY